VWVCYVYSTVHGVTYARWAASALAVPARVACCLAGPAAVMFAGAERVRARHTEALKGQPTQLEISHAGWVGRMGHHGVSRPRSML
jgi:hypothetical protein